MHLRRGWIALITVVGLTAVAACGAPEVTDLGGTTGTPGGTNTPGGTGTPGGSPTPTGSGSPGGSPVPTITNVPSFATWQASIKGYECTSCHAGGSGGLSYGSQTDNANLKYYWFSALCDYSGVAGSQSYNPPTGKFVNTMCNLNNNHKGAGQTVNAAACNAVKAWLGEHPATTPPDCNGNFDYVDSQ